MTTAEILRQVRQVEIRTRRQVTESLVGAYHSVFKGRGLNFAEVREYLPGDEVRSIDWNVTAKAGRPFVRVYEEERELTILLAVDLSASGEFGSGTQSKRALAAELASVLAFSATRNNDKVGLLLFTDRTEQYIPARKGRRHILRVIREILFFSPRGRATDLPAALRFLNQAHRRRAVVFLLSDFLSPETCAPDGLVLSPQSPLGRLLRITHRRHDLVCVDLSDPRESELPDAGLLVLEDAETGEIVELDTGREDVRRRYAEANHRRREGWRRALRQAGIDHLSLSTDRPYLRDLRAFFGERGKRR